MDLFQLLLTMAILFILARVGSSLVSRFGLPGLIGEIIMGIIIANLAFGDFSLMEFLDLSISNPNDPLSHSSTTYEIIEKPLLMVQKRDGSYTGTRRLCLR